MISGQHGNMLIDFNRNLGTHMGINMGSICVGIDMGNIFWGNNMVNICQVFLLVCGGLRRTILVENDIIKL